jgi:3D (Asp-Asp-Asp) domain-containing protein
MRTIILAVIVTLNVSSYTHSGNPTASGVMPKVGMCAADQINGVTVPFGSKITLPDGRVLTVTDRFGGNYNNRLDIFMQSENECWQFGRKNLVCKVEIP